MQQITQNLVNNLAIGDELFRDKAMGFIEHHAIYAGRCANTNQQIVAENQIGFGVRVIYLQDFLNEGSAHKINKNYYNQYQQNLVIARVVERQGFAYDLLTYNCEHFVNDVLRGVKESKQVQNGLALGFIACLSLIAIGSSK